MFKLEVCKKCTKINENDSLETKRETCWTCRKIHKYDIMAALNETTGFPNRYTGGKNTTIPISSIQSIKQLIESGESIRQCSIKLNIPYATVYRIVNRVGSEKYKKYIDDNWN